MAKNPNKTIHTVCYALIFVSCFLQANTWEFNNPFREQINNFALPEHWFDQVLDHSQYFHQSTWKQRYYVFNQFFDSENGPIILYIGGEGSLNGISNTSHMAEIAKENKALILALEHRFYGKSLPFGNETFQLENMKLLTAEQALNDLAYFLNTVRKNKMHKVTEKNKWITIGGSYPGALSAWFRSKFPHLTVGAIASSAVVLAVQDFRDFDEQIYRSAMKSGQQCVNMIRKITQYAEDQVLSDNKDRFQSIFRAQKLTSREFLFYWSDVMVMFIQYGKRSSFCDSISNKTLEEAFNVVKETALKTTPTDYGAYYLRNVTFPLTNTNAARPWIFQSCTEFSYFQTYSKEHPMRSKMLTIDFYRAWCEEIFGDGVWPAVKRVNFEFGGLNLKADNLIMTNGDQDPWRWAGVQKSTKTITARIIECKDCGHCSDLRGYQATEPKALTAAKKLEDTLIKKWLS